MIQGRDIKYLLVTFCPAAVRSRICSYNNLSLPVKAAKLSWILESPNQRQSLANEQFINQEQAEFDKKGDPHIQDYVIVKDAFQATFQPVETTI